MRLLHEIAIFQIVKSKVIISLYETVRLSVSISLRNLYNSLNSIKEMAINVRTDVMTDSQTHQYQEDDHVSLTVSWLDKK